MRTNNRIVKVLKVAPPEIEFITNSGEQRVLNIKHLFEKQGIEESQFGYEVLTNKNLFNEVELVEHAFTWKSLIKKTSFLGNSLEFPYTIDPVTAIEYSEIKEDANFGNLIKKLRKEYKLSQAELGEKILSNKSYISKLENNKTDLELKTLKKIFEVGFEKKFLITYYNSSEPMSFTNSALTFDFIQWAENKKDDLNLIEGIDKYILKELSKINILKTEQLSGINFNSLIEIKSLLSTCDYLETWSLQAKYILNSQWFDLIKLQRTITNKPISKLEKEAKWELSQPVFSTIEA